MTNIVGGIYHICNDNVVYLLPEFEIFIAELSRCSRSESRKLSYLTSKCFFYFFYQLCVCTVCTHSRIKYKTNTDTFFINKSVTKDQYIYISETNLKIPQRYILFATPKCFYKFYADFTLDCFYIDAVNSLTVMSTYLLLLELPAILHSLQQQMDG